MLLDQLTEKRPAPSPNAQATGTVLGIITFLASIVFASMSFVDLSGGSWVLLLVGGGLIAWSLRIAVKGERDAALPYLAHRVSQSMLSGMAIVLLVAVVVGVVKGGIGIADDHAAQVASDKEKTFRSHPEKLVEDLVGNSDIHAEVAQDDGTIQIAYDLDPWALTGSTAVSTFNLHVSKLVPEFFRRNPSAKEISVTGRGGFTDIKGHSSRGDLVKITFTRSNSNSINWSGITYSDLPKIADSYWVHPSVRG